MRVPGEIRVMIVDDHPLLREGIAAVLEGEEKISLVAEAANGRGHFQKGLLKDRTAGAYGINVTLDTKGDFFFERAAGNSLSTQTRYAFPITAAINFPILRNMSLSPTFTSFLYESQVTRQSITVNSFMISAR